MRLLDHLKIPELNFYLIDIACPSPFPDTQKISGWKFYRQVRLMSPGPHSRLKRNIHSKRKILFMTLKGHNDI
jgi:hypothetical protein